jgi:hypothetical protein
MLTLHHLQILEGAAAAILILAFAGGALHLIAGMISPGWVGSRNRRWVAAWTLGVWALGFGIYLGIIAFSRSRPDGPHTFKSYMDRYVARRCAEGADLPACRVSSNVETPN